MCSLALRSKSNSNKQMDCLLQASLVLPQIREVMQQGDLRSGYPVTPPRDKACRIVTDKGLEKNRDVQLVTHQKRGPSNSMSRSDLLSKGWSKSETLGAITIGQWQAETMRAIWKGSKHDEQRFPGLLFLRG